MQVILNQLWSFGPFVGCIRVGCCCSINSVEKFETMFLIPKEKIEEYKKAFKKFDVNGDGKVTMEELETVMRSLNQNPTKLELKIIMADVDTDRNGVITLDEFLAYMSRPPKGRYSEDELKAQFRVFDKDNDGFITKVEMQALVKELNIEKAFPPKLIDDMFNEADRNQDGKISFDEYINAMRTWAISMDVMKSDFESMQPSFNIHVWRNSFWAFFTMCVL